jgi:tetratricopeptide (TPR) repeat protein
MGAVLLGTAAVLGWRWRKTHPLATLGLACAGAAWLPASGLLPAGELLTADRFAMLPSAGLILAAIARSSRLVSRIAPWISRGAVIGMIVAWGVVSRQQIMLWKDTPTLFGSAIARQPSDPLPRVQLGLWHLALGDVSAGEEFLRKAVEADPGCLLARYNLAVSALHALRPDEARQNAEILTRERPDFAEGHWLLSQAHFQLADLPRALAEAQAALRADPTHLPARARVAELTTRRPPPSRDRRPRKQPP